jgi:hypothetical protein
MGRRRRVSRAAVELEDFCFDRNLFLVYVLCQFSDAAGECLRIILGRVRFGLYVTFMMRGVSRLFHEPFGVSL